jgi:myosin heavy subunit
LSFTDPREVDNFISVLHGILLLGEINSPFDSHEQSQDCAMRLGLDFLIDEKEIMNERVCMNGLHEFLSKKRMKVGGETIITDREEKNQYYTRDTLASYLYSKLFQLTVERLNEGLSPSRQTGDVKYRFSLLDIFGFEILEENHLEQILINYANEKLHVQFIEKVIQLEEEEYRSEGLTVENICYYDAVREIETSISIIDSLAMNQASNQSSFLSNLHSFIVKSDRAVIIPSAGIKKKLSIDKFGKFFKIEHFAGNVAYMVSNLIEKNRDARLEYVDELLAMSENPFIRMMATKDIHGEVNSSNMKSITVAKRFKGELGSMMQQIEETNISFIKCIRPNTNKAPREFNAKIVINQLENNGILNAAVVKRSNYPIKCSHEQFFESIRPLLLSGSNLPQKLFNRHNSNNPDLQDILESLSMGLELSEANRRLERRPFQIGKTRVYMLFEFHEHIETLKAVLRNKAAIILQKQCRRLIKLLKYSRIRQAIIKLQKNIRQFVGRRIKLRKIKKGLSICVNTFDHFYKTQTLLQWKELLHIEKIIVPQFAKEFLEDDVVDCCAKIVEDKLGQLLREMTIARIEKAQFERSKSTSLKTPVSINYIKDPFNRSHGRTVQTYATRERATDNFPTNWTKADSEHILNAQCDLDIYYMLFFLSFCLIIHALLCD